jgi:NAD(P)-dependent dehydrogenase (short-subunit alcohol dehydrogenase family)
MVRPLEGRVAIVTGASQGIGEAIAVAFAGAGAKVVVTARSRDRLEALAARIGGVAIVADLADLDRVPAIADETARRLGRIDLLVNNAGIIHDFVDLADFDTALWRKVIDVNLVAPALLTKAVLKSMIPARSGRIINISSIGGRKGGKGRSAYRVTKAGLISLTESVAAEVKKHGIDVNCICPGGVDTEGMRAAFGDRANPNLMKPQEIAELALFLASDASSSITGAAIDAFGPGNPLFR